MNLMSHTIYALAFKANAAPEGSGIDFASKRRAS